MSDQGQQSQGQKKARWLVFRKGEIYGIFLAEYEAVFLFREPDGWCAWYGRWNPKLYGSKPVKSFDIVTGVGFQEAVRRANQFIEWRRGKDAAGQSG